MNKQDSTWIPEDLYAEFVQRMPLCTVDVVLFSSNLTSVLLFLRRNQPAQGEWYTLGGRLLKNESIQECARRQAAAEAGIALDPKRMFFGTVVDEIFDHSRFGPGTTCHTVDICFGYVLPDDQQIVLDPQHERCEWKPIGDGTLHPFVRQKIDALLPLARPWANRPTGV